MADFGLTPTGFVPKTTTIIVNEMKGDMQSQLGIVDVSDDGPAGVLAGIVGAAAGELWEVVEQVNSSTDRDSATFTGLDAIGALTGTIRAAAANSAVVATLTGDPLTLIPAGPTGWQAATASTGALFASQINTVLVALTAWAGSTTYALGDRRTNASRCYVCIQAGTSAASGGPTTQALSIADGAGTLLWAWIGEGTAAVDLALTAVASGVINAVARDLTVIRTPVGGLQNVTNLVDAVPGAAVEADGPYRLRQVEELQGAGAGTAATIRSLLLRLPGVVTAHVFFNPTDTPDVDGLPGHSIEALVQGGATQEIIDLLGEEVVAGTTMIGTTSGTHVDSEGTSIDVKFSRPVQVLIYQDTTLTKVAATYAGDAAVKLAQAEYGQTEQTIGKDVVATSAAAVSLPVRVAGVQVAGVTGVLKIVRALAYNDVIGTPAAWAPSTVYSATPGARSVVTNDGNRAYICLTPGTSAASGGPTGEGTAIVDNGAVWWWLGNDITIDQRHIAVLDTSRMTVHATNATP